MPDVMTRPSFTAQNPGRSPQPFDVVPLILDDVRWSAPGATGNHLERLTFGQRAADRVAARDRLEAHDDLEIGRKAEEEVPAVLEHLSAQDQALAKIVETLAARTNGTARAQG